MRARVCDALEEAAAPLLPLGGAFSSHTVTLLCAFSTPSLSLGVFFAHCTACHTSDAFPDPRPFPFIAPLSLAVSSSSPATTCAQAIFLAAQIRLMACSQTGRRGAQTRTCRGLLSRG